MSRLNYNKLVIDTEILRKAANLSQEQFVTMCGISAASNWSRLVQRAYADEISSFRGDTENRVKVAKLVLSGNAKREKLTPIVKGKKSIALRRLGELHRIGMEDISQ